MLYTTIEAFESLFTGRDLANLTDNLVEDERNSLLDKVNSDVVNRVHGYLRGRYELPLSQPVDGLIIGVVNDLMKVALYRRRDELHLPESIWRLEKQAYDTLIGVQKGTICVSVTETSIGTEGEAKENSGSVMFNAPKQRFGERFTSGL